MYKIGYVTQVQIQRSSLKVGERPNLVYNPSPLFVVDALLVSPEGCVGQNADGARLLDVHNRAHAHSKNSGANGISFNFTQHYQHMRTRFGPHITDGCAGENILIEAKRVFSLAELGKQIVFQNAASGQLICFSALMVAAPCVEFSRFVNKYTPLTSEHIKSTLQFLDEGIRGFYATVRDTQNIIQAGDQVFLLP